MKDESYGAFSLRMHKGMMSKGRYPLNGSIEVTRRCPLTCQHCYNNLPVGDKDAIRTELTLEEHCRILDEIADAGCFWLLLTGGEVFARPDFLDIYDYAKSRGFLITLFTNATMMTQGIIDHLVKSPPFSLEVTLYGNTKHTYERLTGLPGSYDRCMRGVRMIKESGLPLKLKTVATTITQHEISAMRDFAENDLGVEFKFDGLINPRLDCSQSPLHVRLAPEDLVRLDLQDARRVEEWQKLAQHSPSRTNPPSDEVYHCGGGLNSFAINPWGQLSICILSQQELYDLRKGSFAEGWNFFLEAIRKKKRTRMSKCVDCRIRDLCGMCAANGELHSDGDAEKPVEFLCETAHLRALTFDIDVPEHGECEYCKGGHAYETSLKKAAMLKAEGIKPVIHKSKRFLTLVQENEQPLGCSAC